MFACRASSIKTFLEMNSRRIQFRSSESRRKSTRFSRPLTSRQGTRAAKELIAERQDLMEREKERGRERKREEMERSIRHKEISLSRIFDQPLRRANSLVRNNWITSKRGPLSTGKEKVPEKVLEKDRWEKKVRVYPFVENNNL